jgi:hypothetical protein
MLCPYEKNWKKVGQEAPAPEEACLPILVKAFES